MLLILDVLSAAPHALSIVVLFLVYRRKLEKQNAFFVGYLIFNLIAFLTFFTMAQILVPARTYQSALFVYICIYTALTLGVIYELGDALLMSRPSLAALLRSVLRWTLAALVLAAAIGSAFLHEIDIPHWKFVEPLDLSSALIRAGMLLTLFAFAWTLRISWRSRTAGIALGFGITACVDLASAPLRAAFGSAAIHAVDIIQLSGYNVAVLVWLIYLLLPDRKLRFAVNILPRSEMEAWSGELQKMVQRWRSVQRWINSHLNIVERFRPH
jgi:hypothetical protein